MTKLEQMARAICAHSLSGFCLNMGEHMGCEAGRGKTPHWSLCKATPDQLMLSGNSETAQACLIVLAEPDSAMVEKMAEAIYLVTAEPEHGDRWDKLSDGWKENMRLHARAAATAMIAAAGERG